MLPKLTNFTQTFFKNNNYIHYLYGSFMESVMLFCIIIIFFYLFTFYTDDIPLYKVFSTLLLRDCVNNKFNCLFHFLQGSPAILTEF